MASKTVAAIRPQPAKPAKAYLVAGVDEIPKHYRLALSWAAMNELRRSITALKRLAAKASPTDRRDLLRACSACRRAYQSITGGYEVKYVQPLADRWSAAEREVAGHG